MPEHIVDDVRLGQVVHRGLRAHRDRRRKLPLRKEREERLCRQIPGHPPARPIAHRLQTRVHIHELRHLMLVQTDDLRTLQKHPAPKVHQMLHTLLVQKPPHLVVLLRVLLPVLRDLHRIDIDPVRRKLRRVVRRRLRRLRLRRIDHRARSQILGSFRRIHDNASVQSRSQSSAGRPTSPTIISPEPARRNTKHPSRFTATETPHRRSA